MPEPPEHLKLVGDDGDDEHPQSSAQLSDFVKARLKPAAAAYWTALMPTLGVPWNDAYSKSLGMLCELHAERDQITDDIEQTSDEVTGLMPGQNKELRKHPLYTRLNQVEVQIHELMNRFGMTPLSMKRIKSTDRDEANAEQLLKSMLG